MNRAALILCLIAAWVLAACANKPPVPDWQMNAKGGVERAVAAYLSGHSAVAQREFERARVEVARTGQPHAVARVELLRCAAMLASLVLGPCSGFEALRGDAAAPERAYADYLAGRAVAAPDIALLPVHHRSVASGGSVVTPDAELMTQLVGAAVLLQAGRASPQVVAQAVDAASAQGWSRPLLAWLGVQLRLAEQGGDTAQAALIRRRIALVLGKP